MAAGPAHAENREQRQQVKLLIKKVPAKQSESVTIVEDHTTFKPSFFPC